jgi:hypothetical protein
VISLKLFERYLVSLTITFLVTNLVLGVFGQTSLDLYVSVFILEYFVLTLLHPNMNSRIQIFLNFLGVGLFVVFVFIVAVKVLETLFGAGLGLL